MTNEMKLLQELCKALGFDVETIIDRDERKESRLNAIKYRTGMGRQDQDRALRSNFGRQDIDDDGMYTSYLINPVISYKLTRIEQEK